MSFKLCSLRVMIVMMIMLMIIFLSMIMMMTLVMMTMMMFRIKSQALKIYRSELNLPTSKDLGLHGTTRAALRTLCKTGTLSYPSSWSSSSWSWSSSSKSLYIIRRAIFFIASTFTVYYPYSLSAPISSSSLSH